MAYQALYRQWRPQTFSQMVGQEAIVSTLRRQVETGRIAHAYLFSGTRGTGKTTTAQVFARAINCLNPSEGDPCGVCQNCVLIAQGATLDVEEIDAASNNGVDEIRSLREKIQYPPQSGKYRVYIIDEAHMLSSSAFNALLKTLEEPPPHAVLILATTEPQRFPATILSRCQRFDFKRIPAAQIAARLREAADSAGASYEEQGLLAIARAAEGSLRDALNLLDQCIALGGAVTVDAVEAAIGSSGRAFLSQVSGAMAASDLGGALGLIDQAMGDGRDAAVLCRDLASYMRSMMVLLATGEQAGAEILEMAQEEAEQLLAQAKAMGQERALRAMDILARAEPEMRWAAHPRALLELAAARICRPQGEADLAALLQRIEALEARGIAPQAAAPAPAPVPAPPPASSPAPVKAEAPAPAPSPGKEGQALWQEALSIIRKTNISLYTALRRARLGGVAQGVASVVFQQEDEVFCKMMQMEQNLAVLKAALTQASDVPMSAQVGMGGGTAQQEAPPPRQDGWVQEAIGFFGRDKVDILEKGGDT